MHRRLVEGRLAGDRVVLAEVGGVVPLLRFGGGNARAPCLARGWRSVTVEGSRRNRSVCRASSVGGDTCLVTPALRQASHAVPMHKWSMKWTVARFRSVLCLLGAALVAGSAVASSAEAPLPSPIRLNGEEALVASRTIRLGPGSYQATSVITGCQGDMGWMLAAVGADGGDQGGNVTLGGGTETTDREVTVSQSGGAFRLVATSDNGLGTDEQIRERYCRCTIELTVSRG